MDVVAVLKGLYTYGGPVIAFLFFYWRVASIVSNRLRDVEDLKDETEALRSEVDQHTIKIALVEQANKLKEEVTK